MGFTFGTKKSEIVENSGNYLRNFKKGETKVRFLQESQDWHGYFEHFMDGKSFPCMENEYCPGCSSANDSVRRRSRRYGTFVYLVEQKRVLPFKVGAKLSERLTVRAERNGGTLLSRDYIIIRSGAGLETEYDVDQDERYDFDTASAWKNRGDQEVTDILNDSFIAIWGDPEKFIENARAGSAKTGGDKSLGFADEKPPWESDTTTVAGTKEEDLEVTEEALLAMSRIQLVDIWNKAKFEGFDEDWGKTEIVKNILARAS